MEFKDKLIEKLQNEFDEFRKHRNRANQNNLELVDDTLSMRIYIQNSDYYTRTIRIDVISYYDDL